MFVQYAGNLAVESYEFPDLGEVQVNVTDVSDLASLLKGLGELYSWQTHSIANIRPGEYEAEETTEWLTLHGAVRR